MYKNKKRDKRLQFLAIFLFLFFCMLFLVKQENNYSKIEKVIKDFGANLESIFIPKIKETDFNIIDGIHEELEEENRSLKKMLGLQIENYEFIHANVIKRDIDWYQELTIDKGEKDGIELDMAVISNEGLIGRISKTGNSSSVVKLITSNSNDMKVSVEIRNKEEVIHGILDGYLVEESYIQINNISKNKEVSIGDKVYTSGLGGIYPTGIYIGEVVEITYDSLGLNKIVKLKPLSSYDKIQYVTVVNRRKEK